MKTLSSFSGGLLSKFSRHRRAVASITALCVAMGTLGTAALADPSSNADAGTDTSPWKDAGSALAPAKSLLENDDIFVSMQTPYDNLGVPAPANRSLSYRNLIQTSNSTGTATSDGVHMPHNLSDGPVVGRFFDSKMDAKVEIGNYDSEKAITYITTTIKGVTGAAANQILPYSDANNTITKVAVADFDGDGFDEIVATYSSADSSADGNERAIILKAKDQKDPTKGFTISSEIKLSTGWGIRAVAAGDFNGDGRPDLAVMMVNDSGGLWVYTYAVDVAGAALTWMASGQVDSGIGAPNWAADAPYEMRAGRFTNGNNDQLVVVDRGVDDKSTIKLFMIAFAGDYTPVLKSIKDTGVKANRVKLVTGKFAWRDPTDSIALMLTKVDNVGAASSAVWLLNVSDYIMSPEWIIDPDSFLPVPKLGYQTYLAMDITLGNFDHQAPNPTGLGNLRNPDMQLAIALGEAGTPTAVSAVGVGILDLTSVDSSGDKRPVKPLPRQPYIPFANVPRPNGKTAPLTGMKIEAGDYQGRSYRLGAGVKLEIDKMSPVAILAQPPSHADYASPDGIAKATLVNVSVSPTLLNATYKASSTTSSSLDVETTKGWGFAGKESLGVDGTFKAGIGVFDAKSSISETFTAEQELNHSTDARYSASTSVDTDISLTTSMSDALKVEDSFSYLYIYDLVGQKVCPVEIANCTADQLVPATVMFSAPGDSVVSKMRDGYQLSWYQPIWENGNILSYPSTAGQLLYTSNGSDSGAAAQRVQVATPVGYSLSTGSGTSETKWNASEASGGMISFSKTFKEDSATSVSAGVKLSGFGDKASLTTNLSLDFGGSNAFSNVRTMTTTFDSTMAMGVTKGGFYDATQNYDMTSYIYGDQRTAGYVDGTDPNPAVQTGTDAATTIKSDVLGPVRSGFTVDVLNADDVGGFWKKNYSANPDIALNHPARLSLDTPPATKTRPSNCIALDSKSLECVTLAARPDPKITVDPWSDPFHQMRGFFIVKSGEANPNDPNNPGAQQVMATAGDKMTLMSRVYNYSLKDMDPGTKVAVSYYAMVMDTATDAPIAQVNGADSSDSIYLGTVQTGAIPGAGDGKTNYNVAQLDFDTTPYAGKNLAFWVEAHGLSADGSTVLTELEGKGIGASAKAPFASLKAALLAEPLVDNNWYNDGTQTTFSNNVGVYKQLFYVAPASRVAASEQLSASMLGSVKSVSVRDVKPKMLSTTIGKSIEVSAMLHNDGPALNAPKVYFYDGDPAKGGELFGVEYLAHIDQGQDHMARVQLRPTTCGDHQIFVKASHRGMLGVATQAVDTVHVACDGEAAADAPTSASDSGGGCACSTTPGSTSASDLAGIAGLALVTVPFLRRRKRTA